MSNYFQIEFQHITNEQSEMLIAQLADSGYEGFEEGENLLRAFIPVDQFDVFYINEIAQQQGIGYIKTLIEETNWNQVWESNFEPVMVDDFVALRAHFHEPIQSAQFEIVITPKMSFGTGHHATTYMMIQQMRDIDFAGKSVFDFGTGTGVLAILSEKLGAKKVQATDNDEWSITNATENIQHNLCSKIELILSSDLPVAGQFDIILANINKNIILPNLAGLKQRLLPNGILLFSGLLKDDEREILAEAAKLDLKLINRMERNNWLSIRVSL